MRPPIAATVMTIASRFAIMDILWWLSWVVVCGIVRVEAEEEFQLIDSDIGQCVRKWINFYLLLILYTEYPKKNPLYTIQYNTIHTTHQPTRLL